jgi:hypothetical protein
VLGEAVLDLPGLLIRVDMEDQSVARRVAGDLCKPRWRARADGVGGKADGQTCVTKLLDVAQVLTRRGLTKAVDPAARVGDVEQDERDSSLAGSLCGGPGLIEPDVVKLAHRGEAGGAHLAVDLGVEAAHAPRR